MTPVSFEKFDKIYQSVVDEVYKYWTPLMQMEIALHNYGWGPSFFDFRVYLQRSSLRFYKPYCAIVKRGENQSICDVGSFWGVFPLTLKKFGYSVAMTESLKYYGKAFDNLFQHIADNGVIIADCDPFIPHVEVPANFDVLTVMAVMEHYPHSLKVFMGNIISMMKPSGIVYLEVPNISYWPKRINFLRGISPLPPIRQIFQSEDPFLGHHHEFTMPELKDVVELSGLRVLEEVYYNYSEQRKPIRYILRHPMKILVEKLAYMIDQSTRECLAVTCTLKRPNHVP